MRRVWTVYLLRQATSPALRLGLLGGALFVLAELVSFRHVFANIAHVSGLSGLTRFVVSAFATTETSVLVLTTLATALVLWFVVDQVRSAYGAPQTI